MKFLILHFLNACARIRLFYGSGFRRGKAPKEIVEKHIRRQAVLDRAIQDLIVDIYPEIIAKASINPVDMPEVVVEKLEEGKSLILSLSTDVYPEVKLGKYKGLKVAKKDGEETKNTVVEELLKIVTVDIPPGMLKRETDLMIDELRVSLEGKSLSLDEYLRGTGKKEENLREDFKSGAIVRTKAKLALRAIADAEKLKVEDEELEGELGNLSKETGEEVSTFKNAIGEIGIANIKDYLLRRKALDFVVSKAKIV